MKRYRLLVKGVGIVASHALVMWIPSYIERRTLMETGNETIYEVEIKDDPLDSDFPLLMHIVAWFTSDLYTTTPYADGSLLHYWETT